MKFVAYVNFKTETHFRPEHSMVTGQISTQLMITHNVTVPVTLSHMAPLIANSGTALG